MAKVAARIRVAIGDSDPASRRQLQTILMRKRHLQTIGEASSASGVEKLAAELRPDILLLDLALLRGFEPVVLSRLAKHSSSLRTIVMMPAIERLQVIEAFRLGAQGIVVKATARRELLYAIRRVLAGQFWFGGDSLSILLQTLQNLLSPGNGRPASNGFELTARERDIIVKIASGRSNKEVARECAIAERTVKHHLTSIFEKIGVSSRLELAVFALTHRLMNDQDPGSDDQSAGGSPGPDPGGELGAAGQRSQDKGIRYAMAR